MNDVKIIQYFDSRAVNLDYQAVRIRAVVPEDKYLGDKTMNAIRIYIIIRSKNVPNDIDIVLYDNMEKFSDCESYACCLLQAYLKSENFWYAEL